MAAGGSWWLLVAGCLEVSPRCPPRLSGCQTAWWARGHLQEPTRQRVDHAVSPGWNLSSSAVFRGSTPSSKCSQRPSRSTGAPVPAVPRSGRLGQRLLSLLRFSVWEKEAPEHTVSASARAGEQQPPNPAGRTAAETQCERKCLQLLAFSFHVLYSIARRDATSSSVGYLLNYTQIFCSEKTRIDTP